MSRERRASAAEQAAGARRRAGASRSSAPHAAAHRQPLGRRTQRLLCGEEGGGALSGFTFQERPAFSEETESDE